MSNSAHEHMICCLDDMYLVKNAAIETLAGSAATKSVYV